MNYQQAKDYVYGYTDYEKTPVPHALGSYDLRRVEELFGELGSPHLGPRSVHVAGTNGKGSTAAMIASVLTASGFRTGLYTSPHLHTIRERFRVDGAAITEAEFAAIVTRLKPAVAVVNARATYGELTTFELLTALAFAFFQDKSVDFQVMEVGMGGRFDATNVITDGLCVITPIGLDHTAVLGDNLAQIAGEKAGIIKPGAMVVMAPQAPAAASVINETCDRQRASLVRVADGITVRVLGLSESGQQLRIDGFRDLYEITLPLLGAHQVTNVATAVAALETIAAGDNRITAGSISRGLEQVVWPGRLQVIGRCPLVVVDGAHNPPAARSLREAIKLCFRYDRAILVIGASADKDVAGVIDELAPVFDAVMVTRARHPRSLPLARLEAEFARCGIPVTRVDGVAEAVSQACRQARKQDLVCATGSIFVAAEAIRALGQHEMAPD